MAATAPPRLDDLYKMVAYIYGDKLSNRSSAATFAHLVEVCGMLTIHDRNKKREGFTTRFQRVKLMTKLLVKERWQ